MATDPFAPIQLPDPYTQHGWDGWDSNWEQDPLFQGGLLGQAAPDMFGGNYYPDDDDDLIIEHSPGLLTLTTEDLTQLRDHWEKVTPEQAPALFRNGEKIPFDDFVDLAAMAERPSELVEPEEELVIEEEPVIEEAPEALDEPEEELVVEHGYDRSDTRMLGLGEQRRKGIAQQQETAYNVELTAKDSAYLTMLEGRINSLQNPTVEQLNEAQKEIAAFVYGKEDAARYTLDPQDAITLVQRRAAESIRGLPPQRAGVKFGTETRTDEEPGAPTVGQSFTKGAEHLFSSGWATIEAVQEAAGADADRAGLQREFYSAVAEALPKGTKLEEVRGVGDALAFASQQLFEQAPNLMFSMSGGTIGGLVRGSLGAKIGAFGSSYVLETGQIQQGNKALNPDEKAGLATFLAAGPAGALDAWLPGKVGSQLTQRYGREVADNIALRTLLLPADSAALATLRRGAASAGRGAAVEGATEGLQTAIEEIGTAIETNTPIQPGLLWRMVEASVTGALVGAPANVVGDTVQDISLRQQPISELENAEFARPATSVATEMFTPQQGPGQTNLTPRPSYFPEARPAVRPIEQRGEPATPVVPTPKPVDEQGRQQEFLIPSGKITSKMGPRKSFRTLNGQMASSNHAGIDIGLGHGSKVPAGADGVVVHAGTKGGYGNTIIVKFSDGTTALYAHLSRINVEVGEHVAQGEVIGRVGQSGNATGPHLHLERRDAQGRPVNPLTARMVTTERVVTPEGQERWADDTPWEVEDTTVDYDDTWNQTEIDDTFEEATGQSLREPQEEPPAPPKEERKISDVVREALGDRPPPAAIAAARAEELERTPNVAREALRADLMAGTSLGRTQTPVPPPERETGPIDLPAPPPEAQGEATFDWAQPLPNEEPVFDEAQEQVLGFISDTGLYRDIGQPPEAAAAPPPSVVAEPVGETPPAQPLGTENLEAISLQSEIASTPVATESSEPEIPPEVQAQLDAIDEKLFDLEVDGSKTQLRVYLKKLVKQGVIDQAEVDGLAPMFKDRDMDVEDITSEIRTSARIWAEQQRQAPIARREPDALGDVAIAATLDTLPRLSAKMKPEIAAARTKGRAVGVGLEKAPAASSMSKEERTAFSVGVAEGRKAAAAKPRGRTQLAVMGNHIIKGRFQVAQAEAAPRPVFFSALEKAIKDEPAKKATGDHWMAVIGYRRDGDEWVFKGGKGGVKKEEAETTELPDWLQAQTGQITKEEILNFLEAGGVQVEEVVYQSPYDTQDELDEAIADEADRLRDEWITEQVRDWDWPDDIRSEREDDLRENWPRVTASTAGPLFSGEEAGGFEYNGNEYATEEAAVAARDTDIQNALDEEEEEARNDYEDQLQEDISTYEFEDTARENIMGENKNITKFQQYTNDEGEAYTELILTMPPGVRGNPKTAPGTHWHDPKAHGAFAHIRFKTREDKDGNRVMVLEEVQSDWHQTGRDRGYAKKLTDEEEAKLRSKLNEAIRRKQEAASKLTERATKVLEEELAKVGPPPQDAELPEQPEFDWTEEATVVSNFQFTDWGKTLRRTALNGDLQTYTIVRGHLANFTGGNVAALKDYAAKVENAVKARAVDIGLKALRHYLEVAPHLAGKYASDALARTQLEDRARHALDEYNQTHLRWQEAQQALAAAQSGIPDAPFKNTWATVAIKRAIRWAADNDFDRIAWITGELQNGGMYVQTAGDVTIQFFNDDRFEVHSQRGDQDHFIRDKVQAMRQSALSALGRKHVEALAKGKPTDEIEAQIAAAKNDMDSRTLTAEEVKAIFNVYSFKIGDEMVAKAVAEPEDPHTFDAHKVGLHEDGHFFYDRMLPNEVNKLLKPFGVKVEPIQIAYLGETRTPEANVPRLRENERRIAELVQEMGQYGVSSWLSGQYGTFERLLDAERGVHQRQIDTSTNLIRRIESGDNMAAWSDEQLPMLRKRVKDSEEALARLDDPKVQFSLRSAWEEYGRLLQDRAALFQQQVFPSFPITKEMKEAALKGFPLFRKQPKKPKPPTDKQIKRITRSGYYKDLKTFKASKRVYQQLVRDEVLRVLEETGLRGRSDLVTVELVASLKTPDGGVAAGVAYDRLIQLAAMPFVDTTPVQTMRHELVHFAQQKLWTKLEYAALQKWARNSPYLMAWAKERYPDLSPEEQLDEAIAEGFAQWAGGTLTTKIAPPIIGLAAKAMAKLKELIALLGRAFGRAGISKAELKEAERVLREFATGKTVQKFDARQAAKRAKRSGRNPADMAISRALLEGRMTAEEAAIARANAPRSQTAWHGTHHPKIEEFKLDFVGTGVGLAYGWGLYFASAKEYAAHIRKGVTEYSEKYEPPELRVLVAGQPMLRYLRRTGVFNDMENVSNVAGWVLDHLKDGDGSTEAGWLGTIRGQFEYEAEWAVRDALNNNDPVLANTIEQNAKAAGAIFQALEAASNTITYKKGGLYEVKVPETDELLSYETFLNEQPSNVKKALVKARTWLALNGKLKELEDIWRGEFWTWDGSVLQNALHNTFASSDKLKGLPENVSEAKEAGDFQKAASLWLRELGIPGLRYVHRGRHGGHNYVIFDDSVVTIQGRYRLVDDGPLADPTIVNEGIRGRTHTIVMGLLSKLGGKKDYDPTETFGDAFKRKLAQKYQPIIRAETRALEELGLSGLPLDMRPSAWLAADERGYKLNYLTDNFITPMAEEMAARNISNEDLGLYLYARHAPARNARIAARNPEFNLTDKPGSGMTNAEAAQILADFASEGRIPDLEAVASYIDQITSWAQQEMLDGGLVSQRDLDLWFAPDEFYVPLRGNEELQPDVEFDFYPTHSGLRGGGVSVPGKESPFAYGRRSKADLEGIVGNVITQAQIAADRAYRNKIGQTVMKLIKEVGDDNFAKIDRVKRVPVWNRAKGVVEYQLQKRVVSDTEKAVTIYVKVDGTDHKITFNELNPSAMRFVRAAKNLDMPTFNRALSIINSGTRLWSALQTTYNPEFMVRNASRDIQTALVNTRGIEKDVDRKGLATSINKNLATLKPLIAAGWGAAHDTGEGVASRKVWNQIYAEYEANGGKLNFNQVQPIEDALKALDKAQKQAKRSEINPTKWALKFVHALDLANSAVENMTRLAAYKALRDRGVEPKLAAKIVRELTVNFAQHGEWGPVINSFYGFANAALVGNFRLAKSLATDPKIIVGLMLAGFLGDVLNAWLDEDEWDQYSENDKDYHWTILTPDGYHNIHIPVGYGINSIVTAGRKMSELLRGKTNKDGTKHTPLEALGDIASSFANAWSPVQGRGITNILAPSLLDPFVNVWENENHWGRPIRPEQATREEQKVPYSQLSFDRTHQFWKGLAEGLNEWTGGNEVVPGAIDVSPESVKHVTTELGGGALRTATRTAGVASAAAKGALPELGPNDIPFYRAFAGMPYGAANTDAEQMSAFYDRYRLARETTSEAEKLAARYGKKSPQYQEYFEENKPLLLFADEYEKAEDRISTLNRADSAIRRLRDNPYSNSESQKRARNAVFKATKRLVPRRKLSDEDAEEIRAIIREKKLKEASRFNRKWQEEVLKL